MDVVSAYTEVHGICEVLKQVRADADEEFHSVFKEMESMADIADKPISIPLRCGKRTLCNNVEADDAETYYRRTIFLSFLDGINDCTTSSAVSIIKCPSNKGTLSHTNQSGADEQGEWAQHRGILSARHAECSNLPPRDQTLET